MRLAQNQQLAIVKWNKDNNVQKKMCTCLSAKTENTILAKEILQNRLFIWKTFSIKC